MKDYYRILDLPKDATAEQIHKRFRKFARIYHPDKAFYDDQRDHFEEKFKEINEAYQVLSDPTERAKYDSQHASVFGKLEVSPSIIHFGTLVQGETSVNTFIVSYPDRPKNIDFNYSESRPWFEISNLASVSPPETFPLEVQVVADTRKLKAGQDYTGWIEINVDNAKDRVTLLLKVQAPPQKARPPQFFHFGSGKIANTPEELAPLCDRYWDEARGYLYNGNFARWFQTLNRYDLVAVAQKAANQHNDKDAGLEVFLHALDPSLPMPQWLVAPKALDFGSLGAHGKKALNLTIMRRGRGYARVQAETKDRWLQIAPLEVGLKSGEQAILKVEADAGRMAVGTSGRGHLTLIGSDGRQKQIVAQAQVSTLNTLWDRHGVRISGAIIGGIAGLVVSGILIAYCSLEVQESVSAFIGAFVGIIGWGGLLDVEQGCLASLIGLVFQWLFAIVLDNLVGEEPFTILAYNSISLAFYGLLLASQIAETPGGGDKRK